MDGIQFVNIKTSDKYKVMVGYYFVDSEQFIGFIRLTTHKGLADTPEVGDYLCCTQTSCTFRIIFKPDDVTYVIGDVWKESGTHQNDKKPAADKETRAA